MTLHLLKMVWNRKRTNLLITVEIFVSFLILFSVVAFGIYCLHNYQLPMGFSSQNVWAISVNPQTYSYGPMRTSRAGSSGKIPAIALGCQEFQPGQQHGCRNPCALYQP